jgi:hypothetical protein
MHTSEHREDIFTYTTHIRYIYMYYTYIREHIFTYTTHIRYIYTYYTYILCTPQLCTHVLHIFYIHQYACIPVSAARRFHISYVHPLYTNNTHMYYTYIIYTPTYMYTSERREEISLSTERACVESRSKAGSPEEKKKKERQKK